jgi:ATP/maltotriose-dependent transcriptional regulator MalT
MLETIRDFALEQVALHGELSAARQAHAGYFLHFVEANRLRLHGMERRTWLTRYERDYDNIRAALGWAQASGDGATLSRLAASLGWFWELQGRRTEARTWLHAALAVPATQMSDGARVAILHMLGHIANEEGDYERSRRLGRESLALAEALGDRWTAALCRRDLGWVFYVVDNDAAKAVETGIAAASALEAAGDLRNHILAVLDVAIVHRLAGNPAAAATYAEDALAKAREWDDAASAQEALATLAQIAHAQGDFDRALPLMEECLIAAAGYPNGKLIAWAHYHFAVMLLDSGNPQAAAEQYAASARLWQERGEALAVTYCQSGQANCLLRQGLIARARTIYQATLASYRQYDALRAAAWTQWNLAFVATHAGDAAEAEALLHAGRDSFLSRNDTRGVDACEAALAGVWAPVREPVRL